MKKNFSLLAIGLFSFSLLNEVEAKTENEYYTIEYNQCYSEAPPLYDSSAQNESGNPSTASVTVTFDVRAYNNSTGVLISENETVPVNTQVRFDVDLQNNTNISWYITGTDLDSPYGEWSNAGPGQYPFRYNNSCGGGGEWFKETFVTRPTLNFNHSGSSASMSCNTNGSLCTVTGAGTLATNIVFAPISMGFGGHGVGVFPGYEGPRVRTFNYGPTITYPVNVAPAANQAPNPPTITGPEEGVMNVAYSFGFQASDPDNHAVRYGIDWDNNGSVDQWLPGSGHVASNTLQSDSYSWPTEGIKTFQALTQDSNGSQSGWVSHTISLAIVSGTSPTVDLKINSSDGPLSVDQGSGLSITWLSSNATSCNAWGSGWSSGGAVDINGSASVTANQTDTYIIQCTDGTTGTIDSVQVNLSNSLKICQNTCSSGILRGSSSSTGSFTLARSGSQNLVACYNSVSGCSSGDGNVTNITTWSESGSNATSLSGADPKTVTADNEGSEIINAQYSAQTASTQATVTCVPTVSCDNAPGKENYCQNQEFTVDNGCGSNITCNGTKTCNYNWKEVAP